MLGAADTALALIQGAPIGCREWMGDTAVTCILDQRAEVQTLVVLALQQKKAKPRSAVCAEKVRALRLIARTVATRRLSVSLPPGAPPPTPRE
jgi:hypothetical protein